MTRFLALVVVVLAVALGPNLVWLARSTVYVENRGDSLVESVSVFACDESIELGDLDAGESRLRLLPQCGDTTVSVSSQLRGSELQACSVLMDESMSHVDVWFDSPSRSDCELGEPMLSPLLLTRLW